MSWRDCPRQYWLSRIIRMPGQSDVQAALETSQETTLESFNDFFQEPFHEANEDPSQELYQDSYQDLPQISAQDPSQDSAPKLADSDVMVDAARLGTWIHAQLQDIPLDKSGPFPVLGRCDLQKQICEMLNTLVSS